MNDIKYLTIKRMPKLRQPYLVCGIGGWVDGGEVATGTIKYLIKKLRAGLFAEMAVGPFHIYQVPGQISLRPQIKMEDGRLRKHQSPKNQFFYYKNHDAANDLVLFLGTEPNMNWEEYIACILGLSEKLSVSRIYMLGGVLDETPHKKEPNVSCACSSDELKEEMNKYAVQFSSYEGPGSFATSMLYTGQNKGLDVVNMTVRATYYPEYNIIIPRNPKSIRAITRRLNTLLRLKLNFTDLDKEVDNFEDKLEFMASQSARFRNYVEELEKNYVERIYLEPLELSADEAVRMAEEILKQKRTE